MDDDELDFEEDDFSGVNSLLGYEEESKQGDEQQEVADDQEEAAADEDDAPEEDADSDDNEELQEKEEDEQPQDRSPEEPDPRADTESPESDKNSDEMRNSNHKEDKTLKTTKESNESESVGEIVAVFSDDESSTSSWTTSDDEEEKNKKSAIKNNQINNKTNVVIDKSKNNLTERVNGDVVTNSSKNTNEKVLDILENFLDKLDGGGNDNNKMSAQPSSSKQAIRSGQKPGPLSKKKAIEQKRLTTEITKVSNDSDKKDSSDKPQQKFTRIPKLSDPNRSAPKPPSGELLQSFNSIFEKKQKKQELPIERYLKDIERPKITMEDVIKPAENPGNKAFDLIGGIINPNKVSVKPKPSVVPINDKSKKTESLQKTSEKHQQVIEKPQKSTEKPQKPPEMPQKVIDNTPKPVDKPIETSDKSQHKSRRFHGVSDKSSNEFKHIEACNRLLENMKAKQKDSKSTKPSSSAVKDKVRSPIKDKKQISEMSNDKSLKSDKDSVKIKSPQKDTERRVEPTFTAQELTTMTLQPVVPQKQINNDKKSETVSTPQPTVMTAGLRRKTIELDNKYYTSMRLYFKEGKIIGYPEESFKEEAKAFKLRGNKLFLHNKEVIEGDEEQRNIAIEYHLNSKSKSSRSQHRGVVATVKDIEKKYFWGTIKFDVENVINQCRFCNPNDYDLTSYQLWKYIEMGVFEDVMIVRNLNSKSPIFNCSVLDDLTPISLSSHLIQLFTQYGVPNAMRVVLPKESQTRFAEALKVCLHKELQEFIELVQDVSKDKSSDDKISLPMVELKVETNSHIDLPKSEKELMASKYIGINESEDISIFYIFPVNEWLIKPSILQSIEADIKTFKQKYPNDFKSSVSKLTLYFEIKEINAKINEDNEEMSSQSQSENTPKAKKSSQFRELERLQMDSKVFDYNQLRKRDNKKVKESKKSDDDSDSSDVSEVSSRRSVASHKKKRHNSISSIGSSTKSKPFRDQLREQKKRSSIDSIDLVDDSSQQSLISSHTGSVEETKSEARGSESPRSQACEPMIIDTHISDESVPKEVIDSQIEEIKKYDRDGIIQPCAVILNALSHRYILEACNGSINFENVNKNLIYSSQIRSTMETILVSDDSDPEVIEKSVPQTVDKTKVSNDKKKESTPVANKVQKESKVIEKESKVVEKELKVESEKSKINKKQTKPKIKAPILNLSESSSSEEEDEKPTKKEIPKPSAKSTTNERVPPNTVLNKSSAERNGLVKTKNATESASKLQTTPKKQITRKRKRKDSSDDSDYDVNKDEINVVEEEEDEDKGHVEEKKRKIEKEKLEVSQKTKKDIRSKVKSHMTEAEKFIHSSQKSQTSSNLSRSSDEEQSGSGEPKAKKRKSSSETKEERLPVLKCGFCDFQTNQRMDLVMHTTKHRNEKRETVICDICLQPLNSKSQLKTHKEENHPPVFKNTVLYGCQRNECKGMQFETIAAIDEHLLTHVDDLSLHVKTTSKHKCLICNQFTSINMEGMVTHMSQKHRSFKCAFDCDYLSQDYSLLERHASNVHQFFGQPFECKFCDYNTSVFFALIQHSNKQHAIEWVAEESKTKCGLCETTFAFEDDSVIDHLMEHSMNFEFLMCKNCGKRIRKLDKMKAHLNTHHAIGPADGFKNFVANMKELFDDVLKQRENRQSKPSRPQETDAAIAGLMGEEFVDDYEEPFAQSMATVANDAVEAALAMADINWNEDIEYAEPDVTVQNEGETNGDDEYGLIEENDEGDWIPVGDQD